MAPLLDRSEYTVGWVCALSVELAAAQEMLDEEHATPPYDTHDTNLYTCGRIGEHNVVIACLPEGQTGTNSAAAVAVQMKSTFSSVRFGLMVGVGGGVPSEEADVRLGDVVVSKPHKTHGGVVQYDLGKTTESGFERTGALNAPPTVLLNAVANVRARQMRGRGKMLEYHSKLDNLPDFSREAAGPDTLFEADYGHVKGLMCKKCDTDKAVDREVRTQKVVVHYGTIASGNQLMRTAAERDKLSAELGGVLCFEMEAAGLMNSFPCLVVRGICDYADSHKNKRWQPYAAGTAAAYAKEVLSVIPAAEVTKSRTADETMRDASVYCLPFLKNLQFVGRRGPLDELRCRLLSEKSDCRKMTIVGLGGTGKTQVALQFAYEVKEAQPERSIFWVPAVSMETFEQACGRIVQELKIPKTGSRDEDVRDLVKNYLNSGRVKRWLLVVDNADDPNIMFGIDEESKGIFDYLPAIDKGVTVFTTRTWKVAERLTRSNVLELDAMDKTDATEFLSNCLANKNLIKEEEMTNKLLDELTYLPLAIAQAAAYINRNKSNIQNYLQLLHDIEENELVRLMSEEFHDDARYKGSANAVATTWVVSFNQLRQDDESAADLLEFTSCVESKAIPLSLLPRMQSKAHMEGAIGTLCSYSFLARQKSDNSATRGESKREEGTDQVDRVEEFYVMHRLVHLGTRIWVTKCGNLRNVKKNAVRHVADVLTPAEYKYQAVWRAYLPHALRLLEDRDDHYAEELSELCLRVGQCLLWDGRIRDAVVYLKRSCQLRSQRCEEDSGRLSSQYVLGFAYLIDWQVKQAVKLLEIVVKRKEKLAENHYNRFASQHALAIAYQDSRHVELLVALVETIVKAEEMLPAEHGPRLQAQYSLATALQDSGQLKQAVELLEIVVKSHEKLPTEHPDRLASQHRLGRAYFKDGQIEKAIELLEKLVAVRDEVLSFEHPDRLVSQHLLARAYLADGRIEKAIELLEKLVAVRDEVLSLARAYEADDPIHQVCELMDMMKDIKARIPRVNHPSRLRPVRVLAKMRAKLGF